LGNALQEKGRLEDAIRAYREAIRLRPDFPAAYYDLASAIDEKGDLAGAAAAYEEAIRLRPGYAFAYVNLGIVRAQQGDIDRAIACFEEAIRLEAKNARFYCNLAGALGDSGDLDEAAKALEQALKLAPDYAMAFYNLGTIRERQGRFSEALDAYRRSHELGSRERNWRYPSAERMRVCERFVDLEKRLPAILAGEASPAGAVERARLGQICLKGRHLYHASAQFFEQAFSDLPSIVEDFRNGCRYDAACAAALGAYGQGNDAVELTDEERSRWRAQARRWLEADLACWDKCLESGTPAARAEVILNLRRWQSDPKLSPVRDKNRIAELPAVERDAWGDVWKRVDGLLARARQK